MKAGTVAITELDRIKKTHASRIEEIRKLIPEEKRPRQTESDETIITALTQAIKEAKVLTAITRAEKVIQLTKKVNDDPKLEEIKTVLFLVDRTNNLLDKASKHLESANGLLNNRDYNYAERMAKEAENLAREAFESSMHYHIGLSYYIIGQDYTRRKKDDEGSIAYNEAVRQLKAVSEKSPESVGAHYVLALIYHYQMRDTASTIIHVTKARDSNMSTKELQKAAQELRDKIR